MLEYMTDDIFEKILTGEVPAEVVYEDDLTFAFLDINPNNPGHTLVISKKHFLNIFDVDIDTFSAVMRTVHALAPVIKKAVDADGVNIHMNNDPGAGQVVPHLHVHIIPRHEGDGFTLWHGKPYEEGVGAETAAKIRAGLV